MSRPAETLQKLGLTEKESRVYLALLSLGRGSAHATARAANLKRSTTYVVLEDLRKRGLVLKMPGSTKQMFSARSPEELINEMRGSLTEAEQLLPSLMNTYRGNTPEVRTIQFEGASGIREALWYHIDALEGKEIVAFFGSTEGINPDLITLFHEWNEKLAKQGTRIRSLVPNSASLKKFREKDKVYEFLPRVLPESLYTSEASIDITGTFIRVLMFQEEQAIIIENAKVAKSLREIFEIVWRNTN